MGMRGGGERVVRVGREPTGADREKDQRAVQLVHAVHSTSRPPCLCSARSTPEQARLSRRCSFVRGVDRTAIKRYTGHKQQQHYSKHSSTTTIYIPSILSHKSSIAFSRPRDMAPASRSTSGYATQPASRTALDSLPLCSGAVWRGKQTSGSTSYDVEIRISGQDEKGDLCGGSDKPGRENDASNINSRRHTHHTQSYTFTAQACHFL